MNNDYIRRSDVESLVKSFCLELIDAHREIDEVDFNAELQERLKALPGVHFSAENKRVVERLLCEVRCVGLSGGGACPYRKENRCRKIDALEWCMVDKIAETLCGVMVGEWISTEWELPSGDKQVLVLASGKHKNVELKNAVLLADYVNGEWILEQYPEMEDVEISYWTFIPELPGEVGI